MTMRPAFEIGGLTVQAGQRETVHLPLNWLSNHTPVTLPVQIVHGKRDGPTLFVSAAIHGDEVVGVEVIRRILRSSAIKQLKGTLLAVPIVNAYGFVGHTRYLPDRRDLNRSFPGSTNGSMAGQLAHVFMTEIVARSDYGVDLHTGAIHRVNLPQIRADLSKPDIKALATAFGPPVMLHSTLRDGSLRQAAQEADVGILLYEAGEALRFDEFAIRAGVSGVLRVLKHLDMISGKRLKSGASAPILSRSSLWVRAPTSGLFRAVHSIGDSVSEDQVLGVISDPFGESEVDVLARTAGIIVGQTNLPVVNQGDGLFHIARVSDTAEAEETLEQFIDEMELEAVFSAYGPASG